MQALVGAIGSDIGTNIVGQRTIASLRKAPAARILAAPIAALERYRSHRLIPVLAHDVDMIGNFAFVLSTFGVSLTVGKTIIVSSQDDRCFDAADRVLRIADGRIVVETAAAPAA